MTLPTITKETLVKLMSVYSPLSINKLCNIDHSCRLIVMLMSRLAWKQELFHEHYCKWTVIFKEDGITFFWPDVNKF